MSNVQVVYKNGKPRKAKDGSLIFTKDGVYFSLNETQIVRIVEIAHLLDEEIDIPEDYRSHR